MMTQIQDDDPNLLIQM